MKAQLEQLPRVLLPLGCIKFTTFSKVQFFDNFIQKQITFPTQPGLTAVASCWKTYAQPKIVHF